MSKDGYEKYIDVDSFVNYYIIQELVKNIDGDVRRSSFLTKTHNGKFEMYHVWDFDLTMGNCDYFDSIIGNGMDNGYTGWYIRNYLKSQTLLWRIIATTQNQPKEISRNGISLEHMFGQMLQFLVHILAKSII